MVAEGLVSLRLSSSLGAARSSAHRLRSHQSRSSMLNSDPLLPAVIRHSYRHLCSFRFSLWRRLQSTADRRTAIGPHQPSQRQRSPDQHTKMAPVERGVVGIASRSEQRIPAGARQLPWAQKAPQLWELTFPQIHAAHTVSATNRVLLTHPSRRDA